ncbi:MarR family transcriptional regulator, partial [Salmonella enterica subsp. enterica serovar Weltevreden]|nr:MarR family transcriptional regulator [Salmonella enterica subsp. enterica serovar Weltevreden]
GMLAEQLGVEGPTVVPLVDQIERAGLAERRADASDKRAKTIHLTPAGRALAAQAEVRSAEVRSALFAGIPADDLATAIRVLER